MSVNCGNINKRWQFWGRYSLICIAIYAGACAPTWARSTDKPVMASNTLCQQITFAQVEHVVCIIDPKRYQIDLHWKDASGHPFGTLGAVEQELERSGRQPLVTMNAGMYETDLSPVGLFIADGEVLHPANIRDGKGNFYMKPNGVFFMENQKAGVMETQAFLRSAKKPKIATQSGPLLVTRGHIHPRFKSDGESRKIRNGIGVRQNGTVVLAISHQGISFGQFARLFRDELQCPDALYLDGTISRISLNEPDGQNMITQPNLITVKLIGPVISVSKKRQ